MKKAAKQRFALICLVLTTLTFLLFQFSQDRYKLVMERYTYLVIFAFLGVLLLSDGLRKRADIWVGLVMMGWYVVSRILMGDFYLVNSKLEFASLYAATCLALPFAMCAGDRKQTGLRSVSVLLAVGVGITAWLAIYGIILGEQIVLPVIGSAFGKDTLEERLFANLNPNLSAAMFLAAMMLSVWYLLEHGRKWMAIPAAGVLSGLYIGIALTVSRTVMIQFSSAMALAVFCQGLKLPIRRRQLRPVAAAALAAAAFMAAYMGFDLARKLVNYAAIPVAAAETIGARPLTNDLVTLTGRTQIYRDLWNVLVSNPKIFFVGTTTPELGELLRSSTWGVYHAHNAYLQILLIMGIPGLCAALWFSLRTVWAGWRILVRCHSRTTFAQKWLAVSLLVMLLSAITEPYLFAAYLPAYNFVFFLMLGYLLEIERSLRAK